MAQPNRVAKRRLNYGESSDDEDNFLTREIDWDRYVANPQPRSYTLAELDDLIKADCPDEFALTPEVKTLPFEAGGAEINRIPMKPVCGIRLRFGDIDSPKPASREHVYICVGDEGNNRIALVTEDGREVIHLNKISLVQPAKPFWYLCSHGRVLDEAEMKRVKALACYLFLAAGHTQTVHHYRHFDEHLKDAMVWYGQGVEVYMKENNPDQKPAPADPTQGSQARGADHLHEVAALIHHGVREMSIADRDGAGTASQPPKKKAKHEDTSSEMRQCFEQLGEQITKQEKRDHAMSSKLASLHQHEHTISVQQDEIARLANDVKAKSAELESLRFREILQLGRLKRRDATINDFRRQVQQVEEARKQEETKRITYEKELEEHRSAHKRMVAMLSELEK